eukprot:12470177-Alexandrium_andersonii.AAC.1
MVRCGAPHLTQYHAARCRGLDRPSTQSGGSHPGQPAAHQIARRSHLRRRPTALAPAQHGS